MSRFPFGIPNSWYVLAYSEEVPRGEAVALDYLGRRMVAFRGESGEVSVLDAHCPHLGAHLAFGGRVEGDTLRCPFHAWRFDATGSCVEIPYADRIPPLAELKSYPCVERNGMIFVWYHAKDEPPAFEVPDIAEWHDEEFIRPWIHYDWKLKSHPQDMAENGIDWAHFGPVHLMRMPNHLEFDFREHVYFWSIGATKDVSTLEDTQDTLLMEGENWGLGYSFLRQRGNVRTVVAVGLTPIDDETVHLRMGVIGAREGLEEEAAREVLRGYVAEHAVVATQDFDIWENKAYPANPVLCDGDGPIAEYRKWAAQFY